MTKIVVPILRETKEDVIRNANKCIKKGADILEIRLDAIHNINPKLATEIIKEINYPVIATNRSSLEGGFFEGTEEERINILKECAEVADYLDIELQTNEKYIEEIKDTGVKTIVSYHDFESTHDLDVLTNIVIKESILGDVAKIAVMPKNLEDTVKVLNIMSRFDNVVGISLSDLGSYTRVLAYKFNAPFTFATVSDLTAPGQINIHNMKCLMNSI